MTLLNALVTLVAAQAAAGLVPGDITVDGVRVDASGVHISLRSGDMVLKDAHVARAVDCGGKGLLVQGDGDTLTVTNCPRVYVTGRGNTLTARFAGPGTLALAGGDNHATFSAPAGVGVTAGTMGAGDVAMRRD